MLPFVNISNDPDNEYFCDGLAEELLNARAKIDDLKVAARTSAFSFKGKNAEAREIGKTLDNATKIAQIAEAVTKPKCHAASNSSCLYNASIHR